MSPTSVATAHPAELACPPRFGTPRNLARPTLGVRVAEVGAHLHKPLMPWQRHVADVAYELDPETGRLFYNEVVVTVSRQSGKTTLILSAAVHRALGFGTRQSIVYTAQSRNDAKKRLLDEHAAVLRESDYSGMFTVRKQSGGEGIRFKRPASIYGLAAVKKTSGHGETIDLAISDEAFAHPDDRVEQSLRPAMATRTSAQLWVLSTAGDETSTYLAEKVAAGRERETARRAGEAVAGRTAFFEWSAGDDEDPADPATWWGCMPALGHTINEEFVAGEHDLLKPDAFARAYLNRQQTAAEILTVINREHWRACGDDDATLGGPLTLTLDVAPSGRAAAVAMAGAGEDGLPVGEVIAFDAGTGWVVPLVARLAREYKPKRVVLDATGPAGALLGDLRAAGVDVYTTSAGDMAQSCGELLAKSNEHAWRHRNQADLDAALLGAATRPLGDGGFAWARRTSTSEISPLVAITLAVWAHTRWVNDPRAKPVDITKTIW